MRPMPIERIMPKNIRTKTVRREIRCARGWSLGNSGREGECEGLYVISMLLLHKYNNEKGK
jgi:hypothetical protein